MTNRVDASQTVENRRAEGVFILGMDVKDTLCKDFSTMKSLPDGIYDVIVVDAETTDDGDTKIELTITLGPHIGRMVVLRARHIDERARSATTDPTTLLGIPGTLRVAHGEPSFRPELA